MNLHKKTFQSLIHTIERLDAEKDLFNSAIKLCFFLYKTRKFSTYPSSVKLSANKIKMLLEHRGDRCFIWIENKKVTLFDEKNRKEKRHLAIDKIAS